MKEAIKADGAPDLEKVGTVTWGGGLSGRLTTLL